VTGDVWTLYGKLIPVGRWKIGVQVTVGMMVVFPQWLDTEWFGCTECLVLVRSGRPVLVGGAETPMVLLLVFSNTIDS
jgi:hypothetical protein